MTQFLGVYTFKHPRNLIQKEKRFSVSVCFKELLLFPFVTVKNQCWELKYEKKYYPIRMNVDG